MGQSRQFDPLLEASKLEAVFPPLPAGLVNQVTSTLSIRFGKFETTVNIPKPINSEEASAEYKDGFLVIKLPKVKPNQIKVAE